MALDIGKPGNIIFLANGDSVDSDLMEALKIAMAKLDIWIVSRRTWAALFEEIIATGITVMGKPIGWEHAVRLFHECDEIYVMKNF
jgi:hypothetical protein